MIGQLRYLVVGILLGWFLLPASRGVQAAEQNSCPICHSREGVEHSESIHAKRGLSCVDCHGGDPTDVTENAMATRKGFRGKPTKPEIVRMCSSCHSSLTYMEGYGIPTDQFAEYRESSHGRKLLQENDQNVPSCTGCHEKHRILPPTDARSLMHKANVLVTCSGCHSDQSLMRQYGIPTNQYALYVESVHGRALLERGNEAAPDCARCHGTHEATPAGGAVVSKLCGQCHIKELDYFNRSPHKRAMSAKGFSECVSCHASHDIQYPTAEFYDSVCLRCHTPDSHPYQQGQKIKTLLINARGAIDDAQKELDQVKRKGLDVLNEELLLADARSSVVEAIPIQHALLMDDIQDLTDKSASLADEVKLRSHNILEGLRMRRVVLGFLWLGVLGTVLALYVERRRVERKQRQGP